MLYCGTSDGCHPVTTDVGATEIKASIILYVFEPRVVERQVILNCSFITGFPELGFEREQAVLPCGMKPLLSTRPDRVNMNEK